MDAAQRFKQQVAARVAAASHGWPGKGVEVVLVSGQDGAGLSVAYLAAMLRRSGERVGVITQRYIEVGNERAAGSDQADVLGDAFRLHKLLAQMKRAECRYVIIEVPPLLPVHTFAGLKPALVAVRRCGDAHLTGASHTQRSAQVCRLLKLGAHMVACNRDDSCFESLKGVLRSGPAFMTFGTHQNAECQVKQVELHPRGSAVRVMIDHQTELRLATQLTGKQAVYSMVTAAAAAYLLHVPITAIEDGADGLPAQQGYLQEVPATRPYRVVIDGAITPEGVSETLETLKHFSRNRVVAVVAANLSQPAAWRPIIGELVARAADRLVVCNGDYSGDEHPQTVRTELLQGVLAVGAEARCEEVPDRQAALEKALSIARRNDIVVVLCSSQRPYYQQGSERVVWSDAAVLGQLVV